MGDILHSSLSFLNSFSFQNSSHISWDITLNNKGIDDLISRGHGLVNTGFGSNIGVSYSSNNANKLRYHGSLRRYDDFESGEEYSIHIHPSYYFKENINLSLGISYSQANNWLNWLNDDLFGRYERKLLNSTLDINANFSPKQELRFRLQWVAIDAKALAQYQLSNQGELTANSQNIDDFSLSRTALQLRYKYEVAPLSNVYFVFSRGARVFNNNSETLFSLFKPGIDNVTSNNFLIKYRHQFL